MRNNQEHDPWTYLKVTEIRKTSFSVIAANGETYRLVGKSAQDLTPHLKLGQEVAIDTPLPKKWRTLDPVNVRAHYREERIVGSIARIIKLISHPTN